MAYHAGKADGYRVRAEELRAIAETIHDKGAKKTILGAAFDYERMANQMESQNLDRSVPKTAK
jgi:hypothetical protein